ncbi:MULTISPECIES: hypothetical protein [unclassified Mesobacillus]|uniref:hypothetical protein n=1 Tax=unclassified Mesobacillus TaxID=2675270 RepID=UPI00203F6685|nr:MULTISPECIES: hypothetical protein [unclassified Mesobacillus]MCM3121719.1 hypothetical protein [Mesobacillus sp. MER 33]MCM3231683.1 hypothetical protein [Mesobacillus sp. MER 48]
MNNAVNQFLEKARNTLNQAYSNAKETFYSITSTPSASVQQIADYVMKHPDSKVSMKHYLGITLSFYELAQGQMKYYLETNGSKILQLDVHSNFHSVVAYRSYRDQLSLNTPVKFPNLNPSQ